LRKWGKENSAIFLALYAKEELGWALLIYKGALDFYMSLINPRFCFIYHI
jgi:hypothetical protein